MVFAQRTAVALLLSALTLLLSPGSGAAIEPAGPSTEWALYTVGAGSGLFERFGHSVLCEEVPGPPHRGGAFPNATCYDFGVFGAGELEALVVGTLRGEAKFVPLSGNYRQMVRGYLGPDRDLDRLLLPLTQQQSALLKSELERRVTSAAPYAYHPHRKNCATELRDILDVVTGGRVRASADGAPGPSFRALSEAGFSGHAGELFLTLVLLGSASDSPTSAWERAMLPRGLRDLLATTWRVEPKPIAKKQWEAPPTSPHAGRVVFAAVMVLLAGCVGWLMRRGRSSRILLGMFGYLSATVGAVGLGLMALSPFPEFTTNWMVLVLPVTDVLLAHLRGRPLSVYLAGRLVTLVLLALLSAAQVIAQPLAFSASVVALPLALGWLQARRSSPARAIVSANI